MFTHGRVRTHHRAQLRGAFHPVSQMVSSPTTHPATYAQQKRDDGARDLVSHLIPPAKHSILVEPIDNMGPLLPPVWVESQHRSTVLLSTAAAKGITQVPGQPHPTITGGRTWQTRLRPKHQN